MTDEDNKNTPTLTVTKKKDGDMVFEYKGTDDSSILSIFKSLFGDNKHTKEPTPAPTTKIIGKYITDRLDEKYYKTHYSHTESQLKENESFASNIPEPSVYGQFDDDKSYIDSVQLIMDSSFEQEHLKEILEREIVPTLTNCKNVLDIGVGGGELSKNIDKHCAHITVIDTKEESLNHLPDIMGSENNQVTKIKGSILETNIPDQKYDLIVLSHILYYINESDREQLIDKLSSLLDDNGRIIIVYNDGGDREEIADHFAGKNQNFQKMENHILENYPYKYFYHSQETIKTNNIKTAMHIAGVILNDADATAPREELGTYIEDKLCSHDICSIDLTENVIIIGNSRDIAPE
jgi:2-polyprenyl-3-methyl-5-hydroxy-6-metoxy-1,4-benzoquinol methylase